MLILNAVGQYAAEHKGEYPPGISSIPQEISSYGSNLCKYLVPVYITTLPVDPGIQLSSGISDCSKTYRTNYFIQQVESFRIKVSAPAAQFGETISVTR